MPEVDDYRGQWDGSDTWMAPSLQVSLCLYCGVWYGWEEPHGRYMGGCYPPFTPPKGDEADDPR